MRRTVTGGIGRCKGRIELDLEVRPLTLRICAQAEANLLVAATQMAYPQGRIETDAEGSSNGNYNFVLAVR